MNMNGLLKLITAVTPIVIALITASADKKKK